MLIVKALQAQALPGHQAADASAALHNALHTGGVMGDTDPDPTGACGAARIAQVHAVARRRLLIAFSGGFLDQQRPGAFRLMIGQRRLPIAGSDASGLLRPFRMPRTQIHKGRVRRQQV